MLRFYRKALGIVHGVRNGDVCGGVLVSSAVACQATPYTVKKLDSSVLNEPLNPLCSHLSQPLDDGSADLFKILFSVVPFDTSIA